MAASLAGRVNQGARSWWHTDPMEVSAAVGGGRDVHPAEQQIHRFLESLPFMAMSPLLCLHWG